MIFCGVLLLVAVEILFSSNETSTFKATLMSDNQEMSNEELWRQHQAELARQKNEETARRLAGGRSGSGDGHQVASRESERAEWATLVTQEKLQLAGTKFKPIRLPDLWIRPSFGGRGWMLPGALEAHVNGFRYSSSRPDECVDVIYGNVKHAFFQPAEKETITLLHFHLHNHIMVGNKKSKDVQFYVEIEEEERETDRKKKINMDFQYFVNEVNDLWGQPQFRGLDLKFEQPLRRLGFRGVLPYKAPAFIMPTSSCLVELVGDPFLVITLSEIEMVNLERVGLGVGQKDFDMAIVFKDFKRDVFRIDSIPITTFDDVLVDWLEGYTDINFYESMQNLNWRHILKAVRNDPKKSKVYGWWEILNEEVSDSDSEDSNQERYVQKG